jgi:hypothetical protein
MPRVLVTGARLWDDYVMDVVPVLQAVLLGLHDSYAPNRLELMHGNAVGVDKLAEEVVSARAKPWSVIRVPITPEDRRSGDRMAPIIRDHRMVGQGATMCVGFPHPAASTRGTWQTMQFAVDAGIPTYYLAAMPGRPPAAMGYSLEPYHGIPNEANAA